MLIKKTAAGAGSHSSELKVGPNVKTIHFFPCTAIRMLKNRDRKDGSMASSPVYIVAADDQLLPHTMVDGVVPR